MNNNNELIAFSKIEIQILSNIKVPTKIRPKCVDTCTLYNSHWLNKTDEGKQLIHSLDKEKGNY